MVKTAYKNKVVLMIGFKFRFCNEIATARQLILQGRIGTIIMLRNMFGGSVDVSKRWFSKKEISGGGVLIDNGVHAVDLFRFLFGEVKRTSAVLATFVQAIEVEDTARVLLEMENGVLGTIDLSWSVPVPHDFYLEIYGSEGSIMIGSNGLRYQTKRSREWVVVEKEKKTLDSIGKEVSHFVQCVQNEEQPIASGIDGLRALEVIEAAYESANQGIWIEVESSKVPID